MRALVTGGGGFLGRAIVKKLLARGDSVRSLSRGDYPELRSLGVEVVRADLTNKEPILTAFQNIDVVFHVAAKPGVWGTRDSFFQANVVATHNVVSACLESGIQRLVYTSSPSVVSTGRDLEGINEDQPYPEHFSAHYPETKALAERFVRSSNGPHLATVSLRPHLIWGPGDNHLVPRILARARAHKLKQIGPGTNKVDSIYIDNAADAHLLAADKLFPGSLIAGKVYFLSNDEPLEISQLINGILKAGSMPPLKASIPVALAKGAGIALETLHTLLGLKSEPPMTRFLAEELGTSHWFDISNAKRDLGYVPQVSIAEGLNRLETWLKSDVANSAAIH